VHKRHSEANTVQIGCVYGAPGEEKEFAPRRPRLSTQKQQQRGAELTQKRYIE